MPIKLQVNTTEMDIKHSKNSIETAVRIQVKSVDPNHDWLCHLGYLLFIGDHAKEVAKGDKANHDWENTL